ncbi:glycosyltransferase family 1 protein [Mycobacterium simiae]|uniref:Glycosyltransferase family 1 protein n=1 Tax=Mycobacterium simiae TaxID=1784 RepID=A0A5B1BMW0_MYCSI|nr:glycosyltransferase [Mycobacterium simiae]KAA1249451.1 glycosyltransferase family 1 protein [Mycobacterium simiae]
MRIAIVSGDDVAAHQCADVVADDCVQLCAALAAQGHEVTAFVRSRDHHSCEMVAKHSYRTIVTAAGPLAAVAPQQVLPHVGDWAGELADIWSTDPPDVVHALGWLGGLAAQLAARRQGLPTVQTFHGLASLKASDSSDRQLVNTERARLEPLLARNATWVTAGSSADVDALAKLRRSRARLSLLSAGVDVLRYAPVGPQLDRTDLYRILCLAPDPLPHNGFDRTIRVLPKLPGAELVIAESAATDRRHAAARAALNDLAGDLRVADRVRFAGAVAADTLPALLRSADVVACTARQAPRASAALQAMASGVAVVAVSAGALTDTVVHVVTGLLVPPERPKELAVALKKLQTEHFNCAGMGAAARLHAESRFSWERIARDAVNIYRQVESAQELQRVSAR